MIDHGGAAFPMPTQQSGYSPAGMGGGGGMWRAEQSGMSLRDYLAAHSPITHEVATAVFGCEMGTSDMDRSSFMAVWACLRYEYADAMIAARSAE